MSKEKKHKRKTRESRVNKKVFRLKIPIVTAIIVAVVVVSFGAILLVIGFIPGVSLAPTAPGEATENSQDNNVAPITESSAPTIVSTDNDPSKGSDNAPVTIIEFGDFQCSFCGRFYTQSLPQIQSEYIDTGKVKLVYRDFPLGGHQYAQKSAEAAECADDQGLFWEMHDKLFENQNALDMASLKQYAEALGLDTNQFDSCLDSGKYASEVRKDFQDGQAARVSGTPTFFINGHQVVGAQPFATFKQIIDSELAKV